MNTVYLVDDDKPNIDQLLNRRNLFLGCGFEIAGYETNPFKALEEIRAIKPDAVFSDLKMPVMDGLRLWDELRKDDPEEAPVFVIISAYNDYNDVRKLFKNEGFDYLVKPITDNALVDLLIGVRERAGMEPLVSITETPCDELNAIMTFLNKHLAIGHSLEATSQRFDTNPKTVCKMFSKYLNTTFISYLTKLRMDKAEEMLAETDLLVKKIAAQCGYSDHFYFTRVFTKYHKGCSPTEFREARKK